MSGSFAKAIVGFLRCVTRRLVRIDEREQLVLEQEQEEQQEEQQMQRRCELCWFFLSDGGHAPWPLRDTGRVCTFCFSMRVFPSRLYIE